MTTTLDDRQDPPWVADERTQLTAFLDLQRGTILFKASGLSEEDGHKAVIPSPLMTVAGLLSHLRWVEAYWFKTVLDGQPDLAPYSKERPDGEFEVAAELTLAQLTEEYRAECARSNEIAAALDLDHSVPFRGAAVTVRWVLLHMIEETGRHAGHLDVMRELIDGATGE
jgi:uncharacterized damage-inducible protein DinB